MYWTCLDASALAKRYFPEPGTVVVDHLFNRVPRDRMYLLASGLTEVAWVLARKRNTGRLAPPQYQSLLQLVRHEVGVSSPVRLLATDDHLADRAIEIVAKHSLNSTDAILLRSALDLAASLRAVGDNLFLVTSDLRLIRAAKLEGLTTFNPETQSAANLDTLLGP